MNLLIALVCVVAGLLAAFPTFAYAYLDPNSGSMMLQLLLGGAAGFGVVVKLCWRRTLGFLGSRRDERAVPRADTPRADDGPENGNGLEA